MDKIYVTTQGDTWDIIAKKTLGGEHYFLDLIDANPEYGDVLFFSSGIRLVIPEIQEKIPEELPPWKR